MSHSDPSFLITISYDDSRDGSDAGRWSVSLHGEMDASASSELRLVAEILSTDGDAVDFDLTGVSFVDKAGWSAVCRAADTARRGGAAVRVLNPSPAVRRLTDLLSAAHPSRGNRFKAPPLAPVA